MAGTPKAARVFGYSAVVVKGLRGNVREADECVHERELTRMIEFQAGNPLAAGGTVGAASVRSWPRSTKVSRMSCWTFR